MHKTTTDESEAPSYARGCSSHALTSTADTLNPQDRTSAHPANAGEPLLAHGPASRKDDSSTRPLPPCQSLSPDGGTPLE